MDGKTHAALGAATALWLTQPKSPGELVLTAGIGAVAGILPDVDLQQSKASNLMRRVVMVAVLLLMVLIGDSKIKGITLAQLLTGSAFVVQLLGLVIILAFYFYGSKQPHRGFTHSVIAEAIVILAFSLFDTSLVPIIIIGYTSHLVIDLFNTKGEQLLWPYGGIWCFGLCKANGVAALGVQLVSYLAAVAYAAMLVRCL